MSAYFWLTGRLPWKGNLAALAEEKTAQDWDGVIHVWDAQTGDLLLSYTGHTYSVRSLAWSPDGTRMASGGGLNVHIWQAL